MHIIKMQGCGNDFLLIPYESGKDYHKFALTLCNRRLSIGADGIIVMKMDGPEMILYKADGTYEHMDGNALRCFSKYCFTMGLGRKGHLDILTGEGMLECEKVSDDPYLVRVNLGKPNYCSAMLSLRDEMDCFGRSIEVKGHFLTIYSLFLGSVHTVLFTDSLEGGTIDLAEDIACYPIFAKGTNVDFVHVVSKDLIEVKTYERGSGWVLASGDGCAAAEVVAQKLGFTKCKVKCKVEYGSIEVEITKKQTVLMTGPAEEVFSVEYEEEKRTC